MSGNNFEVPPLPWSGIRGRVTSLREGFGLADREMMPVMEFLEKVLDHKLGLQLEVGSHAEMGGAEGYTCQLGNFIQLREDVYQKAWAGEGRARFTVAHEIGHLHLHAGQPIRLARTTSNIPAYRLSEPQANQYAAEILMPPKFFSINDTAELVAARHGVSVSAASHRLNYLKKEGLIKK
ncbi:ImmA/IrrE family metallo-endopeptidase [Hyphomonas oceanitis]|uniref:ImmA/IrrE family metallo-endopeptidase n=1 Tax=Hyphomonas oceanitis TaxID=81033 RepID=UPI0030025FFC